MAYAADQPGDDEHDASDELSPDLELVAQLLADGRSDADAASAVGRSAKFVQRARTNNPRLVARVRELKAQRTAQAAAALGSLVEEAVEALGRCLEAKNPSVWLRAAVIILDRYRDLWVAFETAARIRDLQRGVDELRRLVGGAEVASTPPRAEGVP